MRKRKNKAFTLIELLAVILILGIIALIAIPVVNNIIDEVEMNSILNNMRNLIDAGEKYYARNAYIETSCIDVNDSKLDFKNTLSDMTGTVCFNGSEAYLRNVLYDGYLYNGTIDNLTVTDASEISKPVYTLTEQSFDGVDDYFDTGYALFDEEKDFTIITSFTSTTGSSTNSPPTVFHCLNEASPYQGIALDQRNTRGRIAGNPGVNIIFYEEMENNKIIFAIKHDAMNNVSTFYIFNSSGDVSSKTFTILTTPAYNQHLFIGAYQDTLGLKGRFFKGIIHQFDLYMHSLDDTAIKTMMHNLNS